jgi:hypothetical protein
VPYQADYVLRLIEQLGAVIRGLKQRLSGAKPAADEDSEGAVAQAISLVLGVDPLVASKLSPQTLATMVELGGVHADVRASLVEVIELDSRLLEEAGRPAEAETRRAQAAALKPGA